MANFPTSPSLNEVFQTNKVTYVWNGEAWEIAGSGSGGAGGSGNVVGPSASIDERIVTFESDTGKIIQDSGTLVSDLATAAHVHAIDNLTDVETSSVAGAEVLIYDGTDSWDNKAISGDVTITSSGVVSLGLDVIKETHIDWGLGSGQVSTDDIPEGSGVRQYHTDARVNTLIGASDLSALSDVATTTPTDGQLLTWDNANSTWEPETLASSPWTDSGSVLSPTNGETVDVAVIDFGSAIMRGHMIPDTDDVYDIGSASYKIRDLYVSENSLWIGDNHKIDTADGKVKFRKRKGTNEVPPTILAADGTESGALAHTGESSLAQISLAQWLSYYIALSGNSSAKISDVFRAGNDEDYSENNEVLTAAEGALSLGTYPTTVAPGPAATYDLEFIAAGIPDGTTVTIIDANNVSVTYEMEDPTGAGPPNPGVTSGNYAVNVGASGSGFSNANYATDFAAAVTAQTTQAVSAAASGAVVTFTQDTGGTAGNTTITTTYSSGGGSISNYIDWASGTHDEFAGGAAGSTIDSPSATTGFAKLYAKGSVGTAGTGTVSWLVSNPPTTDLIGDQLVIVTPNNTVTVTILAAGSGNTGSGTNTIGLQLTTTGSGIQAMMWELQGLLGAHPDLICPQQSASFSATITMVDNGSGTYITYNDVNSTGPEWSVSYTDGTADGPANLYIKDGAGTEIDLSDLATSGDVSTAITNLIDSAPGALDTLNELAAALNDDASFSSTMTTALAGKAASSHTHASSDLTSAVPLTLGGTGQTARQASLDALTGTGTATHVLTYDGTNAGWAAGGGGGGNWTATPEDASLDGNVALKEQSSAPSSDASYAKLYSKSEGDLGNGTVTFTSGAPGDLIGDQIVITTPSSTVITATGHASQTAGGATNNNPTFAVVEAIPADPKILLLPFDVDEGQSGAANVTITKTGTVGFTSTGGKTGFGNFAAPQSSSQIAITSTTTVNANNALHFDGAFTIDFWYKNPDTSYGDAWGAFVGPARNGALPSNNEARMFRIYQWNWHNQALYFYDNLGGIWEEKNWYWNGLNFRDGNWHHIAITRDSSNDIRIFVDGVLGSGGENNTGIWNVSSVWTFYDTLNSAQVPFNILSNDPDVGTDKGDALGLEDFRIIQDSDSGWTSNFQSPQAPHPTPVGSYSPDVVAQELRDCLDAHGELTATRSGSTVKVTQDAFGSGTSLTTTGGPEVTKEYFDGVAASARLFSKDAAGNEIAFSSAVMGPANTPDNRIPLFDGTSGKSIKDSGLVVGDLAPIVHQHASSDLTSIVPIELGGTGVGNQGDALTAITGAGLHEEVLNYNTSSGETIWTTPKNCYPGNFGVMELLSQGYGYELFPDSYRFRLYAEEHARPDLLYNFDQGNTSPANDNGIFSITSVDANGVKSNITNVASGLHNNNLQYYWNDCAVFNGTNSKISVGPVAGPPFYFNAIPGTRGDFELVFRFKPDVSNKVFSLLSTLPDPISNTTNGHYSVLFNNAAGAGNGRVIFEYTVGGTLYTPTWAVPQNLNVNPLKDLHLSISFLTDVNTHAGDSTGVGKLRCFLDGVPLDDAANVSVKTIAATIKDVGKTQPASGPLSALYQLATYEGRLKDTGGGPDIYADPPNQIGQLGTGSMGLPGAFGNSFYFYDQSNPSGNNSTYAFNLPDPLVGEGSFTLEFFVQSQNSPTNVGPGLFSNMDGSPNHKNKFWIEAGSNNLKLHLYDSTTPSTPSTHVFQLASGDFGFWGGNGQHVAIVRSVSGGLATWHLYANGALIPAAGSNPAAAAPIDFDGTAWRFGWAQTDPNDWTVQKGLYYSSHWDEIRITKTNNALVAVGGASYTPPSAPYNPPHFAWPLYLGQYLDGVVASSGVGNALFHFDDALTDSVGGSDATLEGSYWPSNPYIASAAGYDKEITISQSGPPTYDYKASMSKRYIAIPDPAVGTGDFTVEFYITPVDTTGEQGLLGNTGDLTSSNNATYATSLGHFAFYMFAHNPSGGDVFKLYAHTTGGTRETLVFMTSGASLGTSRNHIALSRKTTGLTNAEWYLWVNGIFVDIQYSGSRTTTGIQDMGGKPFALGLNFDASSGSWMHKVALGKFDEFRLTKSLVYGTSGNISPAISAPFDDPTTASDNFFDGNMDEFSIYNHRCIHSTDGSFDISPRPIDVNTAIATIDYGHEGRGHVLTTANIGSILPKSVEGLPYGSPWDDEGTVRIAPSTGPVWSTTPEDASLDGVVAVKKQTAAPSATADYGKIYSKSAATAPKESSSLFHFDGNLDDSVPGNPRMVTPGLLAPTFDSTPGNFKFGTHSLKFIGDDGSGNGSLAIIPSNGAIKFGNNPFTIDFWLKVGTGSRGTSGTGAILLFGTDLSDGAYGNGAASAHINFRVILFQDSHATLPGVLRIYMANSSDISYVYKDITGLTSADFNDWQHIAVVRESTANNGTKIYIDGVKVMDYLNNSSGALFTIDEVAGGGDGERGKYPGMVFGRDTYNNATAGYTYEDTVLGADIWLDGFNIINNKAKWVYATDGNFTPPGEHNAGNVTKMFIMDSDGNETKLTP